VSSKRELIDAIIERVDVEPEKLRRLSIPELEQLVAAYKKGDTEVDDILYDWLDSNARIYTGGSNPTPMETKKLFDSKMNERLIRFKGAASPKERLESLLDNLGEEIAEKEEALKPENYLSSREQADRQMADQVITVWEKIFGKTPDLNKVLFLFASIGSIILVILILAYTKWYWNLLE
jgi:hypothetical protein